MTIQQVLNKVETGLRFYTTLMSIQHKSLQEETRVNNRVTSSMSRLSAERELTLKLTIPTVLDYIPNQPFSI